MVVTEKSLTLQIDGRDRTIIVNVDEEQERHDVCTVIGHGASGDSTSGNMPKIAQALAEEGHLVVRYNAGGQLPARCKLLQGILDSNDEALGGATSFILGGHSMGGRTACAVTRERGDVRGVLLLSYPLHPPEKPDQLRDEDLTALEQPVLIVRGSKDAFSTEGPFLEVRQRMSSKRLRVVDVLGGDHSLATKTTAGEKRFEEWIAEAKHFVKEVANDKGWKPTQGKAKETGAKGGGKKGETSAGKGNKLAAARRKGGAKSSGKEAKGIAGKVGGKDATGAARTAGAKAGRGRGGEPSPKKGAKRQKTEK